MSTHGSGPKITDQRQASVIFLGSTMKSFLSLLIILIIFPQSYGGLLSLYNLETDNIDRLLRILHNRSLYKKFIQPIYLDAAQKESPFKWWPYLRKFQIFIDAFLVNWQLGLS